MECSRGSGEKNRYATANGTSQKKRGARLSGSETSLKYKLGLLDTTLKIYQL